MRILQDELHVEDTAALIQLALEQLGRRNLLAEAPAPMPADARVSRRTSLKKLIAAAVALPLILSITAKSVAAY